MTDPLKHGDRRTVTVLFTDLEGFTPLAQTLDPEEVDTLMGSVFADFERIIQRHDGSVEKYIGDAMVAVFGSPRIHEDDPARAVNAALDFYTHIARLNKELTPGPLQFRTGIHTGLITTGKRGDHSVVTGHTMNVAARLQEAASPGTLLASVETLAECGSEFSVGPVQKLQPKGIDADVSVRVVLGRSTHNLREEKAFTGQEDLLQDLLTNYLRFDGSQPGGVILSGEAGIGKTAVAKVFLARLKGYPDFDGPILHARARKFQTRPFAVLIDCFLNLIHLPLEGEVQVIVEQLAKSLSVPLELAARFGKILETSREQSMPGEYLETLSRLFDGMLESRKGKLYQPIIFIDNGSFVDPGTLDFFAYYFERTRRFPFLLVTDRDPDKNILSVFSVEQREVEALDRKSIESLVTRLEIQFSTPLTPEDKEKIIKLSTGVPLFVHSYLRYLGQPERKEEEVPPSIQNVYLSQVSTYNEDIRDLVKKLSVFLHSFSPDDARWLQEKTNGDPGIVPRALDFFVQEEILTYDHDTYFFRHDLQKKVLYASILNYNKRILHRLVAQRMQMQERPHTSRLIHHLIRSDSPAAALEVYKNATDRGVNMEYLPYLEKMLEALGTKDPETRLILQFSRCAVLFNNGHTREAGTIIRDILEWGIRHQHPEFAARAYHVLTGHNTKTFRFQKAYYCGIKALDFYSQSKNPEKPIINLLQILILAESMQNHQERAEKLMTQVEKWGEIKGKEKEVTLAKVEFFLFQHRYREAKELLESKDLVGDTMGLFYFLESAWGRYDYSTLSRFGREFLQKPHLDPPTRAVYCARVASVEYKLEGTTPDDLLNQAYFYALRCQNDFDLLQAECGIVSILASLQRYNEASRRVRKVLPTALGHSAFRSAFTLLRVMAEAAHRELASTEVLYALAEAGHIYRMGMALEPLDLVVYLYLKEVYETKGKKTNEDEKLLSTLTTSFFASGDLRTVQQPGTLSSLVESLIKEVDTQAGRRWLEDQGIVPEIVRFLQDKKSGTQGDNDG
ncbi:MAG: AAA family ATPase [Spirochaetales bacterium]|nr:AAA family ATPase [Spirochaetales bacterium]